MKINKLRKLIRRIIKEQTIDCRQVDLNNYTQAVYGFSDAYASFCPKCEYPDFFPDVASDPYCKCCDRVSYPDKPYVPNITSLDPNRDVDKTYPDRPGTSPTYPDRPDTPGTSPYVSGRPDTSPVYRDKPEDEGYLDPILPPDSEEDSSDAIFIGSGDPLDGTVYYCPGEYEGTLDEGPEDECIPIPVEEIPNLPPSITIYPTLEQCSSACSGDGSGLDWAGPNNTSIDCADQDYGGAFENTWDFYQPDNESDFCSQCSTVVFEWKDHDDNDWMEPGPFNMDNLYSTFNGTWLAWCSCCPEWPFWSVIGESTQNRLQKLAGIKKSKK